MGFGPLKGWFIALTKERYPLLGEDSGGCAGKADIGACLLLVKPDSRQWPTTCRLLVFSDGLLCSDERSSIDVWMLPSFGVDSGADRQAPRVITSINHSDSPCTAIFDFLLRHQPPSHPPLHRQILGQGLKASAEQGSLVPEFDLDVDC